MRESSSLATSRREFLQNTGRTAAASALVAGLAIPRVHAAEDNTIQVALIGCGGRGTGAASNALSVPNGPIKLVAMADVFENKLNSSYKNLQRFGDKFDVPEDRKFLGFDGYQKAMDCLKPGDVAIFATPPAFRWVHFTYAIAKGLNVFMEKPVTVDGPTTRKMIALAEQADKKNLKVGVGLMIRHCRGRQQLLQRIQDGEIGDIIALRAYRMGGGGGMTGPKPADMSEVMYQIQRFHSFLWASGGVYSDFYIHQIDECSWMKGAWPVKAHAIGGRHYRGNNVDQNLDTYGVEYTYPDGTKLFYDGRQMPNCYNEFASYAHGTQGRGGDLHLGPHAGQGPHVQRPQHDGRRVVVGFSAARAQSVSAGMGRPDRGDPAGQAVQRGQTGRRGQPGHLDGPHGGARRPDRDLRRDPEQRPRIRAGCGQADGGRPRTAAVAG